MAVSGKADSKMGITWLSFAGESVKLKSVRGARNQS